LLTISMGFISSGSTAFNSVIGIPDLAKVACRLQITSVILFIIQLKQMITKQQECLQLWRKHASYMIASGVCFGADLIIFLEGLSHTSMSHCLLLNATNPIFLLVYNYYDQHHINRKELIGVAIGFAGIVLISMTVGSEAHATVYGDLLSLASAVVYVVYTIISQKIIREADVPAFHYFFCINFIGFLTATVVLLLVHPYAFPGIFTWMATPNWFWIAYLGIGPGIIGHFFSSFLLKHISAMIVTIFWGLEAPMGSFIGWCFGFLAVPPLLTWLGGILSIVGCTVVTIGASEVTPGYQPVPTKEVDLTPTNRASSL